MMIPVICRRLFFRYAAVHLLLYWLPLCPASAISGELRVTGPIVLSEDEESPESIAFSPDGRYLASSFVGGVKIWLLDEKSVYRTLTHRRNHHIWSVCFGPDGRRLATGGADAALKIWSVETGGIENTIWAKTGAPLALAFSPDGKLIASGNGSDDTITIYDARSGKAIRTLAGHSAWISSLLFTADGAYLISGSHDTTAKIWRVDTGEERRILSGHTGSIGALALTRDGKTVLTSADDQQIKAWSMESGAELGIDWLRSLKGHPVALSPDGMCMAVMTSYRTMKILRTEDGALLVALSGDFKRRPQAIHFSPDGRYLAASDGGRGPILLWRLEGVTPSPSYARHRDRRESVDTAPPEIIVLEPATARGSRPMLHQKTALIKGVVRDESGIYEVTVSGKEAQLSPNGEFRAEVNLAYGENLITIRAVDTRENEAVASITVIRQAEPSGTSMPTRTGTDYALLFAVDDYDEWDQLVNPVFDARTIAQLLEGAYGFANEMIENPTVEVILSTLRRYAGRSYVEDDQLMVFFAGRGQFDEIFNEGYVVAKDSRRRDEVKTSYISVSNLHKIIDSIPCKHIFLVMDVCFGGNLEPYTARAIRGDDAYTPISDVEFINRKLKYKTRLYLTSGGWECVPDRRPGYHSPFAGKFTEALRSRGGDDGILTTQEIMRFVEKEKTQPRMGEFENNEPGSDFLFISR